MPLPIEADFRVQASPVPAQTIFSLEGSIASAPMDCTGCRSNTGLNVVPPSIDFQTPPLAAPTKTVVLPFSLHPATAAIRPLIVAEPILRVPRPLTTPESKCTLAPAGRAGVFELPGLTELAGSGDGARIAVTVSLV